MAMQALRDGASGGILKFFLLGILALAAGGLVFTDVGGFFRGGVSGTDVAKVAGQKISINNFDRLARRTLAQLGITPQQAYQFGYLQEILGSEIRRRLLLKAAQDKGITIDKDYVVSQIQTILAPALQNGMSPEQALATLLRNQGLTENELIQSIQAEQTINLLNRALQSGALITTDALVQDIYKFENESRDIRYISFLDKDFADISEPDDAELAIFYDSTKEAYVNPETRSFTLLTLDLATIKKGITVDDAALKEIYNSNIDLYTTPEQRTIVQAAVQSEEDATTIYEAAQGNGDLKAALKEVTGNTSSYLPAKAFSEDDIVEDIKEPVFAAESKGILEPIKTPLGWTIIALESIEAEKVQSFESVKGTIRENYIEDRLIDETYTMVDDVDMFLADGGSVDDAVSQFGLVTQDFTDINAYGLNPKKDSPLQPALGPDAQSALQTAFQLGDGETSSVFELKDGNFAAIHLLSITPKSYPEFADIKADLKAQWINDQKELGNKNFVTGLVAGENPQSLTEIAKSSNKTFKTIKALKRSAEPVEPLTGRSLETLFTLKPGIPFAIEIEGGYAVAEIDNIRLPENITDENLKAAREEVLKGIQNETMALFLTQQEEKHKASVNQPLLERAYGSASESF